MKITEEQLNASLIELYDWYFKKARESDAGFDKPGHVSKRENAAYRLGKLYGGLEAVEAIILQVMGGEVLYKLWESHIEKDGPEQKDEEEERSL